MPSSEILIDPWTFLDYKGTFGPMQATNKALVPSWIGDNFRRLSAYKLLESYCRNSARVWLDSGVLDAEDIDSRREYGDPALLVDAIKSSLLGDEWSIMVDGAEGDDADEAAKKQLKALTDWASAEGFEMHVMLNESQTIRLGDSFIVMHWDEEKSRPRIDVWDPGFYFPVIDPSAPNNEFPKKIHIAYEYETSEAEGRAEDTQLWVRRMTWELVQVEGLQQKLPWNDKPTDWTCIYSDHTWLLQNVDDDVQDLRPEDADDENEDVDLKIDYIPGVHFPNSIAGPEHFGVSSLSKTLQILDDLVGTDTDLQAASATTGSPPIAISRATLNADGSSITTYGPGTLLETGDGSATMIDTSTSLDALLKYDNALLERLSVNGRIPESMLGRVKPNEVPSGIALALGFAPHTAMIKEMRLLRRAKYGLLLKFACRFMMQNGDLREIAPCTLRFGSFLPADRKETMDLVVQGLSSNPPSISLETAVKMLMAAGFPQDDAVEEVGRIRQYDFSSAAEAIGAGVTPDEVRTKLLKLPENNDTLSELPAEPTPGQSAIDQQEQQAQDLPAPPAP
jgi:hypothetical protein